MLNQPTKKANICSYARADPGFQEGGFIYKKVWGSLCCFILIFLKYTMKMKQVRSNYFIFIGYLKTGGVEGVRVNSQTLSGAATVMPSLKVHIT